MAHAVDRGFVTAVRFAEVVSVGKIEGSGLAGDGIPCLRIYHRAQSSRGSGLDSLISDFQDGVVRGARRGNRRDSTVEASVTWVSSSFGREAWDGPTTVVLVIGGGGTRGGTWVGLAGVDLRLDCLGEGAGEETGGE